MLVYTCMHTQTEITRPNRYIPRSFFSRPALSRLVGRGPNTAHGPLILKIKNKCTEIENERKPEGEGWGVGGRKRGIACMEGRGGGEKGVDENKVLWLKQTG